RIALACRPGEVLGRDRSIGPAVRTRGLDGLPPAPGQMAAADESLQAAALTAGTQPAAGVAHDVSDLAGALVGTGAHVPADHVLTGDAGAQGHDETVAVVAARTEHGLGVGSGVTVVEYLDRGAEQVRGLLGEVMAHQPGQI